MYNYLNKLTINNKLIFNNNNISTVLFMDEEFVFLFDVKRKKPKNNIFKNLESKNFF